MYLRCTCTNKSYQQLTKAGEEVETVESLVCGQHQEVTTGAAGEVQTAETHTAPCTYTH